MVLLMLLCFFFSGRKGNFCWPGESKPEQQFLPGCRLTELMCLRNSWNSCLLSVLCTSSLVGKNNQEWLDLRSISQEKKPKNKLKCVHLLSVTKKTKLGQLFSLPLWHFSAVTLRINSLFFCFFTAAAASEIFRLFWHRAANLSLMESSAF